MEEIRALCNVLSICHLDGEARTAAVLCDNPVQSMDMSLNGPYCQAQMQPGSAVSGCA